MAVEICLGHIFLALDGYGIIPRYDLFSIGIIYFDILAPAIAGIAHRKVRAHLLRNQNRHLLFNSVLSCRHIRGRICTDCELSKRQGRMLVENIIMDVFLILQFPVKVSAVISAIIPLANVISRSLYCSSFR